MKLAACVDGVGILGPGLVDWSTAARILGGGADYAPAPIDLPAPSLLPVAERRRTGRIVKLALAVALEATRGADADAASLGSVFASSGGDGANCHEICATLAEPQREISPTRFTNSVHNAASGYWGIAAGSMRPSQALGAYDASFAAGLLEALVSVTLESEPILLVAYDGPYPEPLHAIRPITAEFAIGLVLSPRQGPRSIAHIEATIGRGEAEALGEPRLETLRRAAPAARSLPLLAALAARRPRLATLEYLDGTALRVEVSPCA